MLQRIEIQNFKGVQTGVVTDLSSVNIFIGRNGSGKSTLLEAIYLVGPDGQNRASSYFAKRGRTWPSESFFFGRDPNRELSIWIYHHGEKVGLSMRASGPHPYGGDSNSECSPEAAEFISNIQILNSEILLSPDGDMGLWREAFKVRSDRLLKSIVNQVYDLHVDNFSFAESLEVSFDNRDFSLQVSDLGAGIQIAIRLFMWAMHSRRSAVLIEEFDAYQHVTALNEIARGLCKLSKENSTQFFLTTHSAETVRAFVEAGAQEMKGGVRVFQTSLTPNGEFTTAALQADQALSLLEAGVDVRKT